MAQTYSFWMVDQVRPGMREAYIESTKKWIAELKEQGVALTFNCFSDMQGGFEYGSREFDMEQIRDLADSWGRATAILDAHEWGRERKGAVISSKFTTWILDRALSFTPAAPELPASEIQFFEWVNFRVRPEVEQDFARTLAELKRLCEGKELGRPYSAFRNALGESGPFYTVVLPARDPGDSYDFRQSAKKLLGKDLDSLLRRLLSTAEESGANQGWALPELSMPAK